MPGPMVGLCYTESSQDLRETNIHQPLFTDEKTLLRDVEGQAEDHIQGPWLNLIINWVCLTPKPMGTMRLAWALGI